MNWKRETKLNHNEHISQRTKNMMFHYTSIKSISKALSPKHWWPFGKISHCKKGFQIRQLITLKAWFVFYIISTTTHHLDICILILSLICRMHLLVAIWEKVCTLSDKPSKGSDKFMIILSRLEIFIHARLFYFYQQ